MFNPAEIEAMPLELEKLFRDLEERIMADVIRKLKANGQEITRATDWQLHRLHELGVSKTEIKEKIKDALKLSDSELERVFSEVIKEGYARDESLYKLTGAEFIPFEDNKQLQQLIQAVKSQTAEQFQNITNSLGFAVRQPDGTLKFQPIADYYQKTLDKAMVDITSGAFDYNTVLKRTIKELTNSGMRTVDYASGWSNRVPVAIRRAVVTGFNQVVARINEDNAEKLGTDTFEVSWHSGHRPSHWWGGRWFTKEKLISVCGLGEADGLCGCNCYHSYSPVVPGASVPTYSKEQLSQMEAEENKKIEYNGKEYTKYEALQRQRKLETRMRAQRQEIKLLQEGEANEDDIIGAKVKYRTTSDEYVRFSEAMNLPQQRERVTVDGLKSIGNIKTSKTVAKSSDSGIIKNIELPVETDQIKSMSVETKNVISYAFDNVMKDYDIHVDEIISTPLKSEDKNIPFRFQPVRGKEGEFIKKIIINTNYDFMGSQEKLQERIMKNYNNKVLCANSIEGLIAHELAHIMTFQDVDTYSGYLIKNKEVTKRHIYGVSRYADASLDGAECIAEAFAAVRCGDKISLEAQKLLDEFIERWKK